MWKSSQTKYTMFCSTFRSGRHWRFTGSIFIRLYIVKMSAATTKWELSILYYKLTLLVFAELYSIEPMSQIDWLIKQEKGLQLIPWYYGVQVVTSLCHSLIQLEKSETVDSYVLNRVWRVTYVCYNPANLLINCLWLGQVWFKLNWEVCNCTLINQWLVKP